MSRPLLFHQLEGQGEVVLLLNGIMMTVASWNLFTPHLTPAYRVLRCDLRGQWLSPGPAPDRVEEHAADLVDLLDHLEIDRVHIVGTSFGGVVGAFLAAAHPQRVRTFADIASTDHFDPAMQAEVRRWRRFCAEVVAGGDRGRLADGLETAVFSAAWRQANQELQAQRRDYFTKLPDTWYQGLLGLLDSTPKSDLRPLLPQISCPTLVIAAGDDRFIPRQRCRAIADLVPGARFEVIEGAGHGVIAEQPERVARLCRNHLE
jgi:3-oxoadipate enol-lactonase